MSASTTPTDRPRLASAAARFTVTLDLTTPPLPEATAYTRVSEPGWAKGMTGSAASLPRTVLRSSARCSSFMMSRPTWTAVTPGTAETAWVTRLVIVSRIGQQRTVDLRVLDGRQCRVHGVQRRRSGQRVGHVLVCLLRRVACGGRVRDLLG